MTARNVGVLVYAISGGNFYLPHRDVFQDAHINDIETGDIVPTFSFLIEHPTRGKYLFDLGLRKHGEGYTPAWNETLAEMKPTCDKDVSETLEENNINPKNVQGIIFSHLHFDHVGDVQPFSSAEIILGGEAESLFEKTYPEDPESLVYDWPKGRSVRYINFESQDSNIKTTLPLNSTFFQRSYDLFSDGSLLLIDAPGHFPGHLAVLARIETPGTSDSDDNYLLLAGDCCHNRQCYMVHPSQSSPVALMSLLVRVEQEIPNVVIILAHEKELEEEGMPISSKFFKQLGSGTR
ncbi:Metallo-hydrolase/oxidoreductase [Gymnopus androsaceus JB14]|uniref:Metallo-hydrolase/oxidoreductase n=1 Tax=Gymnopus androsaceus JB14 TaxID=1447944 RepID=A0A6A4I6E6_9AGAR|nr:Metallo-hydrolase/oxidoreductase [Gymnopus androsaceus JB14]